MVSNMDRFHACPSLSIMTLFIFAIVDAVDLNLKMTDYKNNQENVTKDKLNLNSIEPRRPFFRYTLCSICISFQKNPHCVDCITM